MMGQPLRSKEQNWRAVTIASVARLAKRLDIATHRKSIPLLRLIRRYRRYHRSIVSV